MKIIKWEEPFSLMPRNFWPSLWTDENPWLEDHEGLAVYETDNEVVVKANAPGIPAEKVDVSYDAGVLTIRAEHKETEEEKKKKKTVYREARQARYYYTTTIPCPVRVEGISAEIKDGVVVVTLPRAEGAKPRRITVRASK